MLIAQKINKVFRQGGIDFNAVRDAMKRSKVIACTEFFVCNSGPFDAFFF